MGMNMTEKILAKHADMTEIEPGRFIECSIDMLLANDIMGPPAIQVFNQLGMAVFDRKKIILVPDHFVPNKDINAATLAKNVRDFAVQHEIAYYFEVGLMGIEHVLVPEQGLVGPGNLVIGADSHTCTYGALGCFSTGVGTTDCGVALATGKCWFKVPETIRVTLHGELPKGVGGKDVILTLIGMIGVDGAKYQSIEFTGKGIQSLCMADRFTIANMAIEAGGKNAIFPVDARTKEYMQGRLKVPYEIIEPDFDAKYAREISLNLSELRPVVAFPHLPDRVKCVCDIDEIKIDQVVIGSCTNGRLEDLKIASEILAGKKVHKNVRVIIIPGSQQVYLDALHCGYIENMIRAGAVVSTPTCGPCIGGHMGVLAAGERCVSTTNRNFRGRMGHVDSEIYLTGPQVAAASAIAGKISLPVEVKSYDARG